MRQIQLKLWAGLVIIFSLLLVSGCQQELVVLIYPTPTPTTTPTPTLTPSPTPTVTPTATPNRAVENDRPVVARVNNQPIYLETYHREVSRQRQILATAGVDLTSLEGQAEFNQLQETILEALIDRMIIEQQAAKLSITVTNEVLTTTIQQNMPPPTQFADWLNDNQLSEAEFRETVRVELLTHQLMARMSQDIARPLKNESWSTLQHRFTDWLAEQRQMATIERYDINNSRWDNAE